MGLADGEVEGASVGSEVGAALGDVDGAAVAAVGLSEGDAVVLTEMEHHSDIVPWQMLSKERGVELRYVPVLEDMTLDMEAYEASLHGAKLVCVVHTSNVLGVRNPVERIIEQAHASGARVLLDAAQGAPHTRIDVSELDVDFLAVSAHKMLGPTGIGCLQT